EEPEELELLVHLVDRLDDVEHLAPVTTAADDHETSAHSTSPTGRSPVKGGMVSWPACEMPWRAATHRSVRTRMRRSSPIDQFSTYHTSRCSRSRHIWSFRPLICAHPVIPGRTAWRSASRCV